MREIERKEEVKKMNIFKHLIIALILTFGIALNVSAQKDDQDKRPPKEPPTIPVKPKEPPRENPPKDDKRDNRPKKPESYFADSSGGISAN